MQTRALLYHLMCEYHASSWLLRCGVFELEFQEHQHQRAQAIALAREAPRPVQI